LIDDTTKKQSGAAIVSEYRSKLFS